MLLAGESRGGDGGRLVEGPALDAEGRLGALRILVPQARAATWAEGEFDPVAAVGRAGPEIGLALGHAKPGLGNNDRNAEGRRRLLAALPAMADINLDGFLGAFVTHFAALAAPVLMPCVLPGRRSCRC